jgi:hypothetical protein
MAVWPATPSVVEAVVPAITLATTPVAAGGTPAGASQGRLSPGWKVAPPARPGVHDPHGDDRREPTQYQPVVTSTWASRQVEQVDLAAGAADDHHVGHRLAGHDVEVGRRRRTRQPATPSQLAAVAR